MDGVHISDQGTFNPGNDGSVVELEFPHDVSNHSFDFGRIILLGPSDNSVDLVEDVVPVLDGKRSARSKQRAVDTAEGR